MPSPATETETPPRASRVLDAYARLKDEILSNRLSPGYQAPEPEIAARLGMSRTPVREALIRLEAERLVELVPRRGARVLPVSAEDMREIYEILTALEPDAAYGLALRRPDSDALAPLDAATTEMEAALAHDDLDAWAAADARFHRRLLILHGNDRLTQIVGTLVDQAHRARMVTLRLRARPVRSTSEHRAIVEHIGRGEAEAARELFRAHRDRAAAELLSILQTLRLPVL